MHRGQAPELFWLAKYGRDDREELLRADIRSLYRHEHIAPETLVQRLYRFKEVQSAQLDFNALFGNALILEEVEKVSEYCRHSDGWTDWLIQGDSLLVMTPQLEREGMAGKVQCVYVDPPYGIKYGSNWQMKLNNRTVKDGDDADLTGEPGQIKAYRDTWEQGIRSCLSCLRDRLLVAKELLTESGSCFVQISDENVNLVRCLMDEVFGSGNFVALLSFKKTAGLTSEYLAGTSDYVLWYARNTELLQFRQLFRERAIGGEGADAYQNLRSHDGTVRRLTSEEYVDPGLIPKGAKVFRYQILQSQREGRPSGPGAAMYFEVSFEGKEYVPSGSRGWTATREGMDRL